MPRPVLVTAGATRNPIDAMRSITAYSSGKTGIWLAEALAPHAPVTVLGSPEALLRIHDGRVVGEEMFDTRDLSARMHRWLIDKPSGLVIHAAAVGDYEAEPFAGKIASDQEELLIRMRRAPKIVDSLKVWAPGCFLVSFKAAGPETSPDELDQICRRQLERTRSDLVFGNVIGELASTSTLVSARETRRFPDRGEALAALVGAVLAA